MTTATLSPGAWIETIRIRISTLRALEKDVTVQYAAARERLTQVEEEQSELRKEMRYLQEIIALVERRGRLVTMAEAVPAAQDREEAS